MRMRPSAVGMINQTHHIKLGHCVGCNALFAFNPGSINDQGDNWNLNQPICQECIDRIIQRSLLEGLPMLLPFAGALFYDN